MPHVDTAPLKSRSAPPPRLHRGLLVRSCFRKFIRRNLDSNFTCARVYRDEKSIVTSTPPPLKSRSASATFPARGLTHSSAGGGPALRQAENLSARGLTHSSAPLSTAIDSNYMRICPFCHHYHVYTESAASSEYCHGLSGSNARVTNHLKWSSDRVSYYTDFGSLISPIKVVWNFKEIPCR